MASSYSFDNHVLHVSKPTPSNTYSSGTWTANKQFSWESSNLETSLDQAALGLDLDYFVNTEKEDSSPDVSPAIYSPCFANYHSVQDEDCFANTLFSTTGCHGGARLQSLPKHNVSNDQDDGDGESPHAALTSAAPTKNICVKSPSIRSPYPDKGHDRTSSCKATKSSSSKSESKPALRTATRKAKPYSSQAAEDNISQSATKRSARHSHNMVEKKYRNRLNLQFEQLRAALHDVDFVIGDDDVVGRRNSEDRRWSKAEVLDCARRYILALQVDKKKLQAERKMLLENVDATQRMCWDRGT